jgi:predicted RNA binding protein with dsRBD fold (UPF0201 family)
VEAEINPTETEEKVKTAVANMFGNLSIQVKPSKVGSVLTAEAKNREALENFRNTLRRDRVRAAARKILYKGLREKTIHFCLNKQVAFVGHVSFSQETGECPLGPIKVTIESENPRELIDWIAPRIA